MNSIYHFIMRNLTWVIIILACLLYLGIYNSQILTAAIAGSIVATMAVGLTLGLANISAYVYTNLSFVRTIMYGKDTTDLGITERAAAIRVLGNIFTGVCIVVAIVLGLIFWANNDGVPVK